MKVTRIVVLGLLLGCGKSTADTKQATSAEPGPTPAKQDSPVAERPAAEQPAPTPAEQPAAAPAEPVPAAASADGEFGVKDCDEYMKRIAVCDPYEKHPNIGKIIIDKWRRLKAEGNITDLETLCSRAVLLYECKAK